MFLLPRYREREIEREREKYREREKEREGRRREERHFVPWPVCVATFFFAAQDSGSANSEDFRISISTYSYTTLDFVAVAFFDPRPADCNGAQDATSVP